MKKKKESMLWRVDGEGLPGTSYILGTMHIRDRRAFSLLDLVYEKIRACTAFAAEINLEVTDHQQEMMAMRIESFQWLDQILSPHRYEKMRKIILKGTGLDLHFYRFLHPMIINNLIVEHILSREMSISLDRHLWDFAAEADKEMLGIETFQEQFSLMEKIPFHRHLRDLVTMSQNFSRQRRQMHQLVELYEQGALQRLHQSSKKGAGAFRAMMIYDRNERMAARIADMVRERTLFCAIGAGHLGGGKGILRKLKQLDFSVKPVFA